MNLDAVIEMALLVGLVMMCLVYGSVDLPRQAGRLGRIVRRMDPPAVRRSHSIIKSHSKQSGWRKQGAPYMLSRSLGS